MIPKWILESYNDEKQMLLYTIDGLNMKEIQELHRCVQNEIVAHKRRSSVSSPI
jgi:hypothetical protein